MYFNFIWMKTVPQNNSWASHINSRKKRENPFKVYFVKQHNNVRILSTVWKSTKKHNHAKNSFVKSNNKNLLILLLQMYDFLTLGGIYRFSGLNEFWRVINLLEVIVIKFFDSFRKILRSNLPKIGQLWWLITSDNRGPPQVFKHYLVNWTLLY